MFETSVELLDQLDTVLDQLLAIDFSGCSAETLLEVARRSEMQSRRQGAVRHRIVAALEASGVAVERGHRGTADLLRDLWNVTPSMARREVALAGDLAPRRSLTGEALEPVFAATAEAEAAGEISAAHAQVIIDAVDKIPGELAAEFDDRMEADLVASARSFDPGQLAKLGRRYVDHLDPDGTLRQEKYRHEHRDLTLVQRPDGSAHGTYELTAPCAEALLTAFDALAGPAPAVDGTPDPRTPGQRRHDALEALLRLALRAKELPDVGGTVATVLLTATVDQWDAETGLVTTGHGALISVNQAKRIAGGDPMIVPIVIGEAKEIIAYGTGHRLFTRHQRLAIYARDKGCTWPGCDAPPGWCEINHVKPWSRGGPTCVGNGGSLCSRHHQNLDFNGWIPVMINGIPHYLPPPWLDPNQTPRRNTLHDSVDVG